MSHTRLKAAASVMEAAAEFIGLFRPQSSSVTLLIPPTLQIRAGRCAFHDAVDDLACVELMVAESGDRVGARVVAAPAMFGSGFVIDFTAVIRVLCCFEKVIDQVHGVI